MGYYQHLDLVSFNNRLKVVKAEEVDGAKRYVIGYFEDLMDAWQFASDIKQLGIDDAFVTKYDDGVRDMDFDALDAIDDKINLFLLVNGNCGAWLTKHERLHIG